MSSFGIGTEQQLKQSQVPKSAVAVAIAVALGLAVFGFVLNVALFYLGAEVLAGIDLSFREALGGGLILGVAQGAASVSSS